MLLAILILLMGGMAAAENIDPGDDGSQHAWAENIGWISFASSGANPFVVKTGWNCDPAPAAPSGLPGLSVAKSGTDAELSWGQSGRRDGLRHRQG